jgi:hypothetical protein
VTGRIRDVGQNSLQSVFSNRKQQEQPIFFLIAFVEDAFFRDIYTYINCTIIIVICINIYAVIINNYGRLQDLILLLKFPCVRERISWKFIDTLGPRHQILFARAGIDLVPCHPSGT